MVILYKDIQNTLVVAKRGYEKCVEEVGVWFSSKILATDLSEVFDLDNPVEVEKVIAEQKIAEAFCDKVTNMLRETYKGKCDMDSLFRMLERIVEKGVKVLPDQSKYKEFYEVKERVIVRRDSKGRPTERVRLYNSCVGYPGKRGHFRWNHGVHTLHPMYIETLKGVLWEMLGEE